MVLYQCQTYKARDTVLKLKLIRVKGNEAANKEATYLHGMAAS